MNYRFVFLFLYFFQLPAFPMSKKDHFSSVSKVSFLGHISVAGETLRGVDLNGDGKPDLFQKSLKNGFVSIWDENGKMQKLTFFHENEMKKRIWEEKISQNEWVLKEEGKTYPSKDFSGYTVYEKKIRIGNNQFHHSTLLKKEGDFEESQFIDSRSTTSWLIDEAASVIGYETQSAKDTKKAKQDYIDGLWNSEYPLWDESGMICHDEKIESFRDQEKWTKEMKDIIGKGSWDDLMSYIDVVDCGEDFKAGPLKDALDLGLNCLHFMGGKATSYAAQLVGIITNAKSLSEPSQKMKVDCSRNSVVKYLYDSTPTSPAPNPQDKTIIQERDPNIGASGYSHGTCDKGYPGIVIHPGEEGVQKSMEKQTATVFHEMFHLLGHYHGGSEIDLTYMCTYACFADYAFFSEGTKRVSESRREELIQNAEKYCKGEPGYTKISDEYWKDFEDLMTSAELAPKVVQNGLLENPSETLANDDNFVANLFRKDEFTTDGFVYLMAYTEDYRIYSQKIEPILEVFKKKGFISQQAIHAVRRSNTLDSSSELGRKQFDIVARDIKNAILSLERKGKDDDEITKSADELSRSLSILWRGFCKRNKTFITVPAYCLKNQDNP